MKYDLTVIIPVYNTEKYLRRCLDSIVHQEEIEKCSLRVLCINDGSTDNSENIIREYVEKYPFIELFSKENGEYQMLETMALNRQSIVTT